MTVYAENILLCIAIPLSVCLLFTRGESRRFAGSFLVGMGTCLLSAYLTGFISLATGIGEQDSAIFLSPVIEEFLKMSPLLLFFWFPKTEERAFTGTAVALGAGFATFENICYLLSVGAEKLTFILIRGMVVGVMHLVSILALSVWLLIARRLKALSFPTFLGGLALSVTFHAIYNLLVSKPGITTVIGFLLPPVVAVLLGTLYYLMPFRLTEQVSEEKDPG